MKENRYHISKWIFLSLSILINVFLIVHSCLPSDISGQWSTFISRIMENIANSGKGVNPEHIDITYLGLTYNSSYAYNSIPGYEDDSNTHYLPIGTTKLIGAHILPDNASDKSIIYEVSDKSILMLNQQGSSAALTGIGIGKATVTAYSNDNHDIKDTFTFDVIDLKEPNDFNIPIESMDITLDGGDIIPINIIEESLIRKEYDHEVFLPRYYDVNQLTYTSSDPAVVEIKEVNGINNVLVGKSLGNATITVSNNKGISHTLPITVKDKKTGDSLPDIDAIDVYSDDMDLAREDNTIGAYLNIEDVFYQSLSPLNVRVFSDGRVLGYRKVNKEATTYQVRAISKNDLSIYKDYDINLTNHPINDISISIGGATKTDEGYSIEQGQQVAVGITTLPGDSYDVSFTVTSSNTEVASITNEGNRFFITLNMEGEADITIICNEYPEIRKTIHIISTKRGVINDDNRESFYAFMRKAAGHFALFLLSSIFTTLAIYQFFYKKKYYYLSLISLGAGTLLACLTELIQLIVPSRHGNFIDIATDVLAYLIPILVISLIYLIKDILNRKRKTKGGNMDEH